MERDEQEMVMGKIKRWLTQRKAMGVLKAYIGEAALKRLEVNADSFSLDGECREVTIFYSSISGFVPISEALSPEALFCLVNRYFEPMTGIIMGYQGYIDKFAGDKIIAVWGVPYCVADHAKLACWAAIDQQVKMSELAAALKTDYGVDVRVRMGLNSGKVAAGNMGSVQKFSYTVMGDAANLAARLDPMNKLYGTSIIIGDATYKLAMPFIEARLLDILMVVGQATPLRIYELAAKKGELSSVKQSVYFHYDAGLRLHWERRWDEAAASFQKALEFDPADGPSNYMLKQTDQFKRSAPSASTVGQLEAMRENFTPKQLGRVTVEGV